MENYFEKFIEQEYEWLYDDNDMVKILLANCENGEKISLADFYENYYDFIGLAIKNFCNDEYIIQCIHDWMHDALVTEVEIYFNNKE